jgi:hypothetical protein
MHMPPTAATVATGMGGQTRTFGFIAANSEWFLDEGRSKCYETLCGCAFPLTVGGKLGCLTVVKVLWAER